MVDLSANYKNISKILALINPKDKYLVDRLKKELVNIRKSSGEKDASFDDSNQSDMPSGGVGAEASVVNLYGESNHHLEETSGMAGGAVAGSAFGAWKDGELTEEEQGVMSILDSVFNESKIFNSFYVREYIKSRSREVLSEANGDTVVKVNKLTGMNKLEKFLKQNIKTIKDSYMDLTTDEEQRVSFKAHLLKLLSELFETLFINTEAEKTQEAIQEKMDKKPLDKKTPSEKNIQKTQNVSKKDLDSEIKDGIKHEKEHTSDKNAAKEIALDHLKSDPKYYTKLQKIEEKANINFEIDDHGGDDGKIVDLDGDGKPDKKEEHEAIDGMDPTGRKEAIQVYNKLEKQIADPESGVFANLENDLDRKVFAKWALINLSKHMDKWESVFDKQNPDEFDEESDSGLDGDGNTGGDLQGQTDGGTGDQNSEEFDFSELK